MLFLLITANMRLSGRCVFVNIVLCLQQFFGFGRGSIKLHPLLVCRLRNAVRFDASGFEPPSNCINSLLSWSEDLNDFLGRVVFPELGGVMARAVKHISRRVLSGLFGIMEFQVMLRRTLKIDRLRRPGCSNVQYNLISKIPNRENVHFHQQFIADV